MQEDLLLDSLAMMEGGLDTPPFIDDDDIESVATDLATWCFESFQKANEEAPEGLPDDVFIAYVTNAIGAAFIAGCLDTVTNQPEQATPTTVVRGESGATYNFYFN
jgi:hypothetical protein